MERNFLLYAAIVCLLAFLLIFLLIYSGISSSYDTSSFMYIFQNLNVPQLNSFFVIVTTYGREFFWIPVVLLLFLFGKTRGQKAAIALVVVFIIVIIAGLLLKDAYYRARPFNAGLPITPLVTPDMDSSFPSGHAMIVTAGAVIAWLMLKKRYSVPLLIEAILVCYSRLYVGAHYPLDVVGGALLGAGIALLVVYLFKSKSLDQLTDKMINVYKTYFLAKIMPSK